MLSTSLLALALAPAALAHFNLKYPTSRGFDEDKETTFPCGSFDTVESQRTDFPIGGGPIQIVLGHQQTNLAVYMAVGDNPGDGFSVVLQPQFQVTGYGNLCLGNVSVPAGMNITEGTKASIQVIANSPGENALYQVRELQSTRSPDEANANEVHRCKLCHRSPFRIGLQYQLQQRLRRLGHPNGHLWKPQRHKCIYKRECLS